MKYCREHKADGVMFLGENKVYGLCERDKKERHFKLVAPCGVKHHDVLSFATKKEAQVFCKENGVPYFHIIKYGNRFESIWAISWGSTLGETWVHTKGNFS